MSEPANDDEATGDEVTTPEADADLSSLEQLEAQLAELEAELSALVEPRPGEALPVDAAQGEA